MNREADFIRRGSRLARAIQRRNTSALMKCCSFVSNSSPSVRKASVKHLQTHDAHHCCRPLRPNQAKIRQSCLCTHLLAACQGCLHQYFRLVPITITQMAAVTHQSSIRPPAGLARMPALCCSAHYSSVWLAVRLYKTTIFLQFITRFPGN